MEHKKEVKFTKLIILITIAYVTMPIALKGQSNILFFMMTGFLVFATYVAADKHYRLQSEADYLPQSIWEFNWIKGWMAVMSGMLFAFLGTCTAAAITSYFLTDKPYTFVLGKINGYEMIIAFNLTTLVVFTMLFAIVIPMFIFPFWMISKHEDIPSVKHPVFTIYRGMKTARTVLFFLISVVSVFISMKLFQLCFA